MSGLFFLFLLHASLGLLVCLPFVPDRAGTRFFKFCSGAAASMTTAALGLLVRRYGTGGGRGAPGDAHYPMLLAIVLGLVLLTLLYNRGQHFGWPAFSRACLFAALAAGGAALVLAASGTREPLQLASDLTSVLLLGAAASAMILGHWYLVVLDLPITALRRLTVLLALGLALRTLVVCFALLGPAQAGWAELSAVAVGRWSPDGVFVWMRLLFGLAGPLSLIGFVWKTVEIRSTQSATGILYVELFLVLAGELLAKYLRVAAGFPL